MAKKVADKVELKTPITKKEESPIKLTQVVNKDDFKERILKYIEENECKVYEFGQEEIPLNPIEAFDSIYKQLKSFFPNLDEELINLKIEDFFKRISKDSKNMNFMDIFDTGENNNDLKDDTFRIDFDKTKNLVKENWENLSKITLDDFQTEILPIGEPPIENNVEDILQDIIPIDVEEFVLENILNSVDTIQTIERGKLDLVKELILNSQNLEAISLLKSIQTAENWKVDEIISKL